MLKKEYREMQTIRRERHERVILENIEIMQPIYMLELSRFTYFSEREVRDIVQRLRLKGHEICGDDNGYWIAEKSEELSHTINRFKARIRTTAEVICALEDKQKAMREAEKEAENAP